MHAQVHPVQPSWITYAITLGFFAIVMVVRLRRMGRMRSLNLRTLWVVPALYTLVAGLAFLQLPPTVPVTIACLFALMIGGAVGWVRGKMMQIHVDAETHALNQKASPAAMLFLILLVGVRVGARSILGEESGVSPAMLTDPLIAFALGMFSLTRLEMYLRAKRLIRQARARV